MNTALLDFDTLGKSWDLDEDLFQFAGFRRMSVQERFSLGCSLTCAIERVDLAIWSIEQTIARLSAQIANRPSVEISYQVQIKVTPYGVSQIEECEVFVDPMVIMIEASIAQAQEALEDAREEVAVYQQQLRDLIQVTPELQYLLI